jgi:hypothetical protein
MKKVRRDVVGFVGHGEEKGQIQQIMEGEGEIKR